MHALPLPGARSMPSLLDMPTAHAMRSKRRPRRRRHALSARLEQAQSLGGLCPSPWQIAGLSSARDQSLTRAGRALPCGPEVSGPMATEPAPAQRCYWGFEAKSAFRAHLGTRSLLALALTGESRVPRHLGDRWARDLSSLASGSSVLRRSLWCVCCG